VQDGMRIARASGVGIDLDPDALAPDAAALADLAAELDADPWAWVLHGGEEHAMLATFPVGAVPAGFRPIGRVHEAAQPLVTLGGRRIRGRGFDHFEPPA
jgi:thiamine-monophosphate kinase